MKFEIGFALIKLNKAVGGNHKDDKFGYDVEMFSMDGRMFCEFMSMTEIKNKVGIDMRMEDDRCFACRHFGDYSGNYSFISRSKYNDLLNEYLVAIMRQSDLERFNGSNL